MSDTRTARGGAVVAGSSSTTNPPQDVFELSCEQALALICAGNEKRARELQQNVKPDTFALRCGSLAVVLGSKSEVLPYLQSNPDVLLIPDRKFHELTPVLLKAIPTLRKHLGNGLTYERLGDSKSTQRYLEDVEQEATLAPELRTILDELRARGIHAQAWLAIVAYGFFQSGDPIGKNEALPLEEILTRTSSHISDFDRNREALKCALFSLVDSRVITKIPETPEIFFLDIHCIGHPESIQKFVSFVAQNIDWLMKHFWRKPIALGMSPHDISKRRNPSPGMRTSKQVDCQSLPLEEVFSAFIESTHDDESKARDLSDALLERTSNSLEEMQAMLRIFSNADLYQTRFAFELVVCSMGPCLSQLEGGSQEIAENIIQEILKYFERESDDEIRAEAEEFLREEIGQYDQLAYTVLSLSQRNQAAASFVHSITRNRAVLRKIALGEARGSSV